MVMQSFANPKKNAIYIFYVALIDTAARPAFKAAPTLATGDFKVSTDGGAFANLGTIPAVTPAGGIAVKVTLSAAEMDGDNVVVQFIDASGAQWDQVVITLVTSDNDLDDISSQVGQIGTAGGAALNFAAVDDNVDGPLNSITFVGTQASGTFVSTEAEQGTYHQIDDDTNVIDLVYQFNIGGGRTATEIIWKGYLSNSGDSMNMQMYDFVGSDWETRAAINGRNQAINETIDFPVLAKHTGTGAMLGLVFIRFITAGGSNQQLNTDELICEAVGIGESVGYANGQIWVDTVNGTAGTENFVNGTADNAVITWADALTLSASLGITDFHIINGSTIQLSADSSNYSLFGDNWTLDLNGQNINGSFFHGASVSGISTSTTGMQTFNACVIDSATIPDDTHMTECGLKGTITLGEAGNYFFHQCHMAAAGGSSPVIDYGAALNASTCHVHAFRGLIEIQNMGAGTGNYILNLDGHGRLTLNANNSATATANIAGHWDITDNANGAITLVDDARFDIDQVLATQLTESYAANGVAPTLSQAMFAMHQYLMQFGIAGTNYTVRKLDDSTTAFIVELNDAVNPTDAKRA